MAAVRLQGCQAFVQAGDEQVAALRVPASPLQPVCVMNNSEWIFDDLIKAGDGAAADEIMIAQAFIHPEIGHNACADPHRHRFQRGGG